MSSATRARRPRVGDGLAFLRRCGRRPPGLVSYRDEDETKTRRRGHAKRTEYAFADLRRALAKDIGGEGFGIDCQGSGNASRNPLIATVLGPVAQLNRRSFC
jgi:hypothetical protein